MGAILFKAQGLLQDDEEKRFVGLLGLDRKEVSPLGHMGIRELADLEGDVVGYCIVTGLLNPESIFKKTQHG